MPGAPCRGVIGTSDEVRGMIIKAFVVLRAGQASNEAMIL